MDLVTVFCPSLQLFHVWPMFDSPGAANQKAALGSADANLINWKSPWVSGQIRVNSAAKDPLNPNKVNAYDMTASFEFLNELSWT